MSYDYYDDENEPTTEELEEEHGWESTSTKIGFEKLKIEFDTENFTRGIIGAVACKVKNNLYKEIVSEIKKEVLEDIQQEIRVKSGEIVKEILDDYVQNEKITVGGNSFWDDEPLQEYSMKEYAKKCIADAIKNEKFTICTGYEKSRYGNKEYKPKYEQFEFDAYIRSQLGLGNEIKQYLDSQIMEIRDNVNKDIKDMFNESTKQMLSDSVLKVLMANETYQKIQNNISCIASKTEE